MNSMRDRLHPIGKLLVSSAFASSEFIVGNYVRDQFFKSRLYELPETSFSCSTQFGLGLTEAQLAARGLLGFWAICQSAVASSTARQPMNSDRRMLHLCRSANPRACCVAH